jgi:branched-subunit amino acid transport protein
MKPSIEDIWLAITLMALLTYLARSLPFMLSGRSAVFNRLAEPDSPLSSLGPCLLIAICASTVLPMLVAQLNAGRMQIMPSLAGLAGTMWVMKFWQNVGLAVIVGMLLDAVVFALLG